VCVVVHDPVGPHWLFEAHVTQTFPSQTSPFEHWLFDVQVWQPPVHSTQPS
jgi:hypothetical protein